MQKKSSIVNNKNELGKVYKQMEKWDLYTKDRIRTGNTINKNEEVPEGFYRTVVHVSIFNSKGEMLIQQRQEDKKLWPNLWDVSVGGSVIAGETSSEAASIRQVVFWGLLYIRWQPG